MKGDPKSVVVWRRLTCDQVTSAKALKMLGSWSDWEKAQRAVVRWSNGSTV